MPDPTPTPEVTPGLQTSEGKAALIALVLSVLATVVPTLASLFTDIATKFPDWKWTGPVIGVLGIVGTVLTALGYTKQRTALKVAALEAQSRVEK